MSGINTHLIFTLNISRFLVLSFVLCLEMSPTFRKLKLFPSSFGGREAPNELGPKEGATLNLCTYLLPLSPEDEKRSKCRNLMSHRILEFGQSPETKQPSMQYTVIRTHKKWLLMFIIQNSSWHVNPNYHPTCYLSWVLTHGER